MNFLFDENTSPYLPKVLNLAFRDENGIKFFWVDDKPFCRGMKDPELFKIIRKNGWGLLSYDKFRGHPLEIFKKDCLVLRLVKSDWHKLYFHEQCWRIIKLFHANKEYILNRPLGKIYKVRKSGIE